MDSISPTNPIPLTGKGKVEAMELDAMKLTENSYNKILDEMMLRDRLEYDPTRTLDDGGEEEDQYLEQKPSGISHKKASSA